MFSVISTITEIIIALAGITISIIEVLRVRRENKREKMISETERMLVEKVSKASLNAEFDGLFASLDQVIHEDEGWDDLKQYLSGISDSYIRYAESLTPIYEQLLKDESTFSLSYGFGRYIDALRLFINSAKKARQNEDNIKDFFDILQLSDNETKRYLIHEVRVLGQYMERYPMLNELELEDFFEKTKQRKFRDYTKDKEEGVYALFRMYYKMLQAVKSMKQDYDAFSPIVEELKIKYS